MTGDFVSAGTFVAAVLEQAGFVTQARFMENLQDFFRDAGTLVYFIGAVGGLLSVMMFGSFRAAQYLLIGPALYWFLVGPTIEIDGAVAKLGGGQQRGFIGSKDSVGDRNDTLDKAGMESNGKLKVSEAFWLFVKPIDDFVEEFVDIMLKNEDGADLQVASKVRGLEIISRALPNQTKTIHLIEEEILKNCQQSYASAFGAAESYIKQSVTKGLSTTNAAANRATHQKNYDFNYQAFKKSAEETSISINTTTPVLKELIESHGRAGTGSALLKSLYNSAENKAVDKISCAEGWNVYFEKLWNEDSVNLLPQVLSLSSGEWESEEAKQKACEELTRKMYDDAIGGVGSSAAASEKCDLRPGVSLALLWNHLSRKDTFQRVLQRHSTDNDPLNSIDQASVVGISSLYQNRTYDQIVNGENLEPFVNQLGTYTFNIAVAAVKKMGKDKFQATQEWAPAVTVNLIQGLNQSEQIDLPAYEMTRLRQTIYTYATQLPYYQGLILYIIAVTYPFGALIVLLPGRAPGFLNFPLAWLWVKSWDIGFAAVILLEKVMYNMLPNWSVNPALRQGPWTYDKLPLVLGEGYNFSHIQGVGYHYAVLSMVTLGIPAIMGAFTLKAKKAILANFTEGAANQSRDGSARASAAHSIVAANERAQMLYQLGGMAKQSPILGDGGITGGLKGASAIGLGMIPTSMKALSDGASALHQNKNLKDILGNITDVAKNGADTMLSRYKDIVKNQATFESEMKAAYDPLIGRFGALQMSADAAAAALDGAGARVSGGFETNNPKASAFNSYNALTDDRLNMLIEASKASGEIKGNLIAGMISNSSQIVSDAAAKLADGKNLADVDVSMQKLLSIAAGAGVAANELNSDPMNVNDKLASLVTAMSYYAADHASEGYRAAIKDENAENGFKQVPMQTWARMWGVAPEYFADPNVERSVNEAREKGGFAGALMGAVYDQGKSMYVPGGSAGISSMLEGMGGNRTERMFTLEEAKQGVTLAPPTNDPGVALGLENSARSNPLYSLLGIGNPELIYQDMGKKQEMHEMKASPAAHSAKLNQTIEQLRGFELFSDIRGGSPEETARAIIDRVKEIQSQDASAGNRLQKVLPPSIDEMVKTAPITALDAVGVWYNRRASAVMGEAIKYDAQQKDRIMFKAEQNFPTPLSRGGR